MKEDGHPGRLALSEAVPVVGAGGPDPCNVG